MLMGLSDLLELGNTPEEKEEIRASIRRVRDMRDEDIDYSDIPEMTGASGRKPAKPFLDRMRKNNRRIDAIEKGLPDPDELVNRGMGCLTDSLGADGAEMFLHIVVDDRLDYAKWRGKTVKAVAAI